MINFGYLDKAHTFYENRGYQRIEAPWTVSAATTDITKPENSTDYVLTYAGKSKNFVASGEQSFLYLINKGFLPSAPNSRFQTTTPCMRYESFDDYHTKYFIKNELIIINHEAPQQALGEIMATSMRFFESLIATEVEKGTIDTPTLRMVWMGDDTADIELNGIEIGSYGIRSCEFCHWVYGTGLAEPRFSRIIEKLQRRNIYGLSLT